MYLSTYIIIFEKLIKKIALLIKIAKNFSIFLKNYELGLGIIIK